MTDDYLIETMIGIRMTCPVADAERRRRTATVSLCDGPAVARLAADRNLLGATAERLGVGPVLHLQAGADARATVDAFAAAVRGGGETPAVVAVEGAFVLALGRTPQDALRVRAALEGRGAVGQAIAPRGSGRLAGRVVIVTGSAQGFGKGIAEELAAEGACIWVADISDAAGEALAAQLNGQYGAGLAGYSHVDVTRLESIDAGVKQCVKTFGGVDIFVSNAGVLRAGGLDDMDEAAFDTVTAVNYKAYFLCAKAVSAVMKLQHGYDPGRFMDIIQINSKSGLQGSNRNFAYAGSKFGSIGLTQSFALELLPHHIKVNAVCPGNYFEGPLWSDPEKGLFVQYLRANKVPGARTIDDVKKAYLSKIPMNRGCLPADVAKAILYLHEQEYETGQALPVTGGQVMLS